MHFPISFAETRSRTRRFWRFSGLHVIVQSDLFQEIQ